MSHPTHSTTHLQLTLQLTLQEELLTHKEEMDLENAQTTTTAKLPILKQENENSFKPVAQTTTNTDGTSTSLIPHLVTTEEKAQKKNDVKARSMLLMTLPNKYLMTFNHNNDAKTLFVAIQIRFGGNDATKKTQKTLLKQMNKPDLDKISFDDLYNNFKIVEQDVKGTASSSSQNMAFMSSASSTMKLILLMKLVMLTLKLALLAIKLALLVLKNQDNSRRTVNVEETSSKAMVDIDEAGFD
ncbi:hypothetical protein Tco_0827577 [Tanacetum coccineum]